MAIRRYLLVFLHAWMVACAEADSSEPLWSEAERACSNCVNVESLPGLHGSVRTRYLIVSTIYSPPGSKQCRDNGMVEYGSASRLGATTSIRSTFREDVSVRAVVPEHEFFRSLVGEYSVPDSDPSALSIAKNRGIGLGFPGPCEDGIKRDEGLFVVWLEPTLQLAIQDDAIVWSVDASKIDVSLLRVSDLAPYTSIDTTLPQSLRKHGLQSHDVSQILMTNPLLGDEPGPLEPPRFLPFKRVKYRADKGGQSDREAKLTQPPIPKDADLPLATLDYAVHFEVEGNDAFQDKLRSLMVDADRWTWTLSNAGAGWAGNGEIATLRMGSASADYEGPPMLASYYDTLFQSFAFAVEDAE